MRRSSRATAQRDLNKEDLYESVKTLIDEKYPHLHLNQHKLFTLFSVAFQYLLFKSTKCPGVYLIRIEDRPLADKLVFKAKDPSTRRFLQSMLIPRKIKFGQSIFLLDFFTIGSWSLVNQYPSDRLRGAIIVKDTVDRPFGDEVLGGLRQMGVGEHYYYESLQESFEETLLLSFGKDFDNTKKITLPIVGDGQSVRPLSGVKISSSIDIKKLENS